MKKVSFFLFVILVGLCTKGFSQTTTPPDFFADKWEITVAGTPAGDAKFVTDLVRKDGKLTGELKDPANTRPVMPITKVDEEKDKMTIYFNSDQAGEIGIELAKVDNDHLKGQLMSTYEATAQRAKP